jgi:predicted acetyltransferase
MTRLVDPHIRYHRSYLVASDESAASGDSRDGDGVWREEADDSYAGFEFTRKGLEDPARFEALVAHRLRAKEPDAPRRSDWVPCTFVWMVDDPDTDIGSVAIRHELNDYLLDRGGHIGYSVRPSARRQGHATAALRQSLGVARGAIGLDRVLVTCQDDNAASRAVIEASGGVYEDTRDHTRRYWITTR